MGASTWRLFASPNPSLRRATLPFGHGGEQQNQQYDSDGRDEPHTPMSSPHARHVNRRQAEFILHHGILAIENNIVTTSPSLSSPGRAPVPWYFDLTL